MNYKYRNCQLFHKMKMSGKKIGFTPIIYFLFFLGVLEASAQQEKRGAIFLQPEEESNRISILFKVRGEEASKLLKSTTHFRIERAELSLSNTFSNYKKVGETRRVKSVNEMRALLKSNVLEGVKRWKNISSDEEVLAYLTNEYEVDSLNFLGMFSFSALEATGLGFRDTQAEKGIVYSYKVTRIATDGSEELWGENKVVARVVNPFLDQIQIKQDTIISSDSLIRFRFSCSFPSGEFDVAKTFPMYESPTSRLSTKDQKKVILAQNQRFVDYLNKRPIVPQQVIFHLYYRINQGEWTSFERFQVSPDENKKYVLGATIKAAPESFVEVKTIPELLGGIQASADSVDVFGGYVLSQMNAPFVTFITAQDTINGVKLQWEKLPNKPYIEGVILERLEGELEPQTLAVFYRDISTYIDFNIKPGIVYTYQVRALYNPKQNVKQSISASTSISPTVFSVPLPPYNLRVDTASRAFPILHWDAPENPAQFGFIVYRGTKSTNLSHLGEIVKGNTFVDSTGVFSPKVRMYYAVVTQSVAQDTSDYSNVVTFKPIIPLEVAPPPSLNYKLINGKLFLDWFEMRSKDSFIGGYKLERRSSLDSVFRPVVNQVIVTNYFTDTTIQTNELYEYRIASVADDGHVGVFSPAFEVDFPQSLPSSVAQIRLSSTSKGVLVKWPTIEETSTAAYTIYRNDPPSGKMLPKGKVNAGSFEWLDTEVQEGKTYLYAMTILDKEGSESLKSQRKTIQFKKITK